MSSYGPFESGSALIDWTESRVTLENPYSYAIINRSEEGVGIAALMDIRPAALNDGAAR